LVVENCVPVPALAGDQVATWIKNSEIIPCLMVGRYDIYAKYYTPKFIEKKKNSWG